MIDRSLVFNAQSTVKVIPGRNRQRDKRPTDLLQRHRLGEDAVGVLLHELLQRLAQQDGEGLQLVLQAQLVQTQLQAQGAQRNDSNELYLYSITQLVHQAQGVQHNDSNEL